MPCATPVRMTGPEVARARITSPSARPPRSTPRISASKLSIESPLKTVRTSAFWPGLSAPASRIATGGVTGAASASAGARRRSGIGIRIMGTDYSSRGPRRTNRHGVPAARGERGRGVGLGIGAPAKRLERLAPPAVYVAEPGRSL